MSRNGTILKELPVKSIEYTYYGKDIYPDSHVQCTLRTHLGGLILRGDRAESEAAAFCNAVVKIIEGEKDVWGMFSLDPDDL